MPGFINERAQRVIGSVRRGMKEGKSASEIAVELHIPEDSIKNIDNALKAGDIVTALKYIE